MDAETTATREAVQDATKAMTWALPVILAVRAWRDHDYGEDKPGMRRGAELEQAILDAINDFDEYAALTAKPSPSEGEGS
ncbi:MAG: hypothetical protein L0227_14275 [Chloroflexi bacterium]|nr:hypothetical protein [Chloroflexota bacterium]